MKPRVLFVDDEPLVLRAIERELRAYSDKWDVELAGSGAFALELLAQKPYDVLVTDMVMPGVDGAALLHHTRQHYPAIVRIVLSGHADFEHAVRSVPFAHQRLLKPWGRDELTGTLARAVAMRDLVGDDLIRQSIGQVGSLPSSVHAYSSLGAALDAKQASFSTVAAVVASDMAMSAKVMQLANSAFVASRRRVTDIEDAVRTVGLAAIRQYLLSPYLDVFNVFSAPSQNGGFARLGAHAALTARIAAELVPGELRSQAFVTGMLHDIGSLVLLTRWPADAASRERETSERRCEVQDIERRQLGVTHAEIGAFLLGLWGLPPDICDAVHRHHERGAVDDGAPLLKALRVADWLAHEHEARSATHLTDPHLLATDFDDMLLGSMGAHDNVPALLATARRCASGSH